MRHFRLRAPELARRDDSGAIRFPLPNGEALRLAPRFGSILDELARGIPEDTWIRLEGDPEFAGLALALSDHQLIESSETMCDPALGFQVDSKGAVANATPLLCCLLLLAFTGIAFTALRALAEMPQEQLPTWGWLLAPIAFMIVLIVHELGHALAARMCGYRPRILLWSGGALVPRCVLTSGAAKPSGKQHALILAAGPATDAFCVVIAALALSYSEAAPWPAVFALCASLAVIANLRPSGQSDMNQILDQIARPNFRKHTRFVVAITLTAFLFFLLNTLLRLIVGD